MVFIGCVGLWIGLAVQPESGPAVVPVPRPAEQAEAEVPAGEVPEAEVPEAEVPEAEVPEAEVPEPEPEPVEMAAPVSVESVAALEPLPVVIEPVVAPPPEVELPERDGRGLLRGSIGAGVVGWGASLVTFGAVLKDCRGLGCGPAAFPTLIGLRWVGNGAALGLAIPGAVYRGRYHATAEHLGLETPRRSKAYVHAGAATLGVGAAAWLITRFAAVASLADANPWSSKGYAGYFMSLQLSWTMASVGAGLLSYGLAHDTQRKKLGVASLQVVPQLGRRDAGLSIAGRF